MSGNDGEIAEIRGLLQEEDGTLKKGAEQHDEIAVRNSGEKLRRAVQLETKYFEDLEQEVRQTNQELEGEINNLQDLLRTPNGELKESLDDLDRFRSFMNLLEQEIRGNGVPDDKQKLMNGGGTFVLDGGVTYGLEQANIDLRNVLNEDLNPISNYLSPGDESVALENLKQSIRNSVELHQELNEYKKLLMLAKNDDNLLEKFAQNENLGELENVGENVGERINELESRIDSIEDVEKKTIELLEQASEIISNRINFDESILEDVRNSIGSESEGYLMVLEEIESEFDNSTFAASLIGTDDESIEQKHPNLNSELENLRQNLNLFRNAASDIVNNFDEEEQEIYHINQAIQEYVEYHRELISESQDMEDGLEDISAQRSTFDAQGYNPNNDNKPEEAFELFEIVEELSTEYESPRELIERFEETKDKFKEIHKLDEHDQEGISDFEGRLRHAETDLKNLKLTAKRFVEEDSFGSTSGTKLTRTQLDQLLKGGADQIGSDAVGFDTVIEDVEELRKDVTRLYDDEKYERNTFHGIKQELKNEINSLEQYKNLFEQYLALKKELVGSRWDGGNSGEDRWSGAKKFVSHQLFMNDSKISSMDEALQEYNQLLETHLEIFQKLEQELEDTDELLYQEVKLREGSDSKNGEVEEMLDVVSNLETFREDFKEVVIDLENASEGFPDELTRKLNKIENEIENIETELDKIEKAKNEDGKDVEHLFEVIQNEEQEMKNDLEVSVEHAEKYEDPHLRDDASQDPGDNDSGRPGY